MITVLTTTYNRVSTLPRLFESLCAQTCKEFEWLIIDDGSIDDTQKILAGFASSAPFKIRVVQQLNSGKHVALNNGATNANTPWLFIVDSDDALVPTAIKTILSSIDKHCDEKTVGLCYRRAYFDKQLLGVKLSSGDSPMVLTPTGAAHLFKGDLAHVFKTEVLIRNKFPVFSGEKFVPELYIWNKIGDEGVIYFFASEALYLCDYLDDGYSKNFSSNLRKNPKGFLVFYWSQIGRETSIFFKAKYLIRSGQCCLYTLFNRFS